MRRLTLTFALALAACGDDTTNTATAPGTTTGDTTATPVTTGDVPGTTTGDPTTSGGSQSGTTTDLPMTTTASSDTIVTTSTDGTTTDASTSTSSSTGDTSTTDDTTTGVMLGCDFDGPELDATLVHNIVPPPPPPPCGTIEFIGQNQAMSPGPVYALDGCPCNSDCFAPDPWTFTLDVPQGNLPHMMPICPRIVVERTMSKQGCELVGVTIFETENQDIPVPWYIAGSLLGPPAAAAADLEIEQLTVETCADCPGCCNDGERYDLRFTAFNSEITLAEGEVGVFDAQGPDIHHDVTNFQSHHTGICDASPAIDWIVNLTFNP